jgi:hypothetical protein
MPSSESSFGSWHLATGTGEHAPASAQQTQALLPSGISTSFIPLNGSEWHLLQELTPLALESCLVDLQATPS